jgi:hypothetical protein
VERFASSPEERAQGLPDDPVYHPSADVSRARSDHTNYIGRHWHGDLSLPVSYWINGWLLGIGYIAGTFPITYRPSTSITYAIGLLIVIALGFFIQVWQLIGLWRSARKHTERGGRRIWAALAQVSVIFGWLSFARGIVGLLGLDPAK